MKHVREASVHQLIDKIKHGYEVLQASNGNSPPFGFRGLLAGALGLGVGLASLCWSLRNEHFWAPSASEQVPFSESPKSVAGLQNLGNNCFLNSILQSLASSRYFLPFLQNLLVMDDVGEKQNAETLPLVVSLTSLLEELCLVRDEKTVLNPRRVMVAMSQYIQGFSLTRQQDAAEAFIHLLSTLEKEIMEHYLNMQHGGSLAVINAFSSRIYSQEKGAPNEFVKWQKLFIGPFDGIVGSYLACQTCSTMLSADLEFFRSLPLSPVLDEHADIIEGCSILDCLKHFTEVERVDNYRCSRCWHRAALKHLSCRTEKDEVKIRRLGSCVNLDSCGCKNLLRGEEMSSPGISHALKKLSFIRFPKVLSFHLQRASMNWHGELIKLQGHISFPSFLDLSPFMEAATCFGQLNYAKYRHNNLKVQDGTFVPSINHFLKQQNSQMLPHLCRSLGDKPSPSSISISKLARETNATEMVVDLHKSCTIQETGCSKKVEVSSRRSSKSCLYCLCSVVEHYGRPGSGHYAVFRKVASPQSTSGDTRNGSWVYISDGEVRCVGEEDALTAEASMLFYEKVEGDR